MKKAGRIEEIDILKGVAIAMMVLGHSGVHGIRFFFQFHMAVFFMASGFTWKQESSDSLRSVGRSVLARIRRLWLPFFFWNGLCILLNNWLIRVNILTDNPELFTYTAGITNLNLSGLDRIMTPGEILGQIAECGLFMRVAPLTDPTWFLVVLFFVSVIHTLADWFFRKCLPGNPMAWQAGLSVLLLGAGFWCQVSGIKLSLWFDRVLSTYHLYWLGTLLARCRPGYADWTAKRHLPALVLSLGVLAVLYVTRQAPVDLAHNRYPDPLTLPAAALAGWVFLYSGAWFLKRTPLRPLLLAVGKRTLIIVALHYLAFKLVNAAVIRVYGLPAFCLAARPHLYGDRGLWWAAFTAAGVACPLLLQLLYERVKAPVLRRLRGPGRTGNPGGAA